MVFLAENVELRGVLDQQLIQLGNPAERILARAEEYGADLIVMGTRGRSGLAHVLIGSVAEGVLRRSRRPVLVVPGRAHPPA